MKKEKEIALVYVSIYSSHLFAYNSITDFVRTTCKEVNWTAV